MLSMLKVDLGITTYQYDERLQQIINSAKSMIEREGVTFEDELTAEDMQLIVMYAAWLWRRRDTHEGMPRMIRWALNDRIFGEKMK